MYVTLEYLAKRKGIFFYLGNIQLMKIVTYNSLTSFAAFNYFTVQIITSLI